jgi:hypothetical protein
MSKIKYKSSLSHDLLLNPEYKANPSNIFHSRYQLRCNLYFTYWVSYVSVFYFTVNTWENSYYAVVVCAFAMYTASLLENLVDDEIVLLIADKYDKL